MDIPPELTAVIVEVPSLDAGAMALAKARLDQLTKPPGSLGRLERLAIQIAGISGDPRATVARKAVIVAVGDHGVVAEGVSAYPQEVTVQMVANFLAGGAAINVIARRAGARVVVVDFGVVAPLAPCNGLINRRVRAGTANMTVAPAMAPEEAAAAILAGVEVLESEYAAGLDIVAAGEMGIGNSTAAAALIAALTGEPPASVTGRGTGIDGSGWQRKVAVVERALALHRPDRSEPFAVLSCLGGLEIAGLVGVMLGAARRRIPVILDGFISCAAALVAVGMCLRLGDFLISSHLSAEPGHRAALRALGLAPLLDLDMRLGEGTGAALALSIVDSATGVLNEMATFAEAGVSGPST